MKIKKALKESVKKINKDELSNEAQEPSETIVALEKDKSKYISDEILVSNDIQEETEIATASTSAQDISADETIVEEDDMFDIYKDHEADEFGHKKYEPEEIMVKVTREDKVESDYLTECLMLKDEILKMKNETDSTIELLVEKLENTHVNKEAKQDGNGDNITRNAVPYSIHVQRHMLASIGKSGLV